MGYAQVETIIPSELFTNYAVPNSTASTVRELQHDQSLHKPRPTQKSLRGITPDQQNSLICYAAAVEVCADGRKTASETFRTLRLEDVLRIAVGQASPTSKSYVVILST